MLENKSVPTLYILGTPAHSGRYFFPGLPIFHLIIIIFKNHLHFH